MINSKFPDIKETIFATISRAAIANKATNLGQGFPNFSADEYLLGRANHYINEGLNQYAPMSGLPQLREQISLSQKQYYNTDFDMDSEITVTSGATEAVFCAISSVVGQGDEVIIFDPAYDSYNPNVRLNGGVPIHVNLDLQNLGYDWNHVESLVNEKTKMIVLNTPHNPTGITLTQNDLDSLWEIVKDKNIYILSDDVYQHIIYDNKKHISPINDERFVNRTFSVSSFGKSFHITGWKVGYCLAPKDLTTEFRKIHQYTTFCTFSAIQMAIADMMKKEPQYFEHLGEFYQEKRDKIQELIKKTQFKIIPCSGSYFQLIDYSSYSDLNDFDYAMELIKTHSLASIPISSLYNQAPDQKILRLCFAKTDDELIKAFSKFN